MLGKCRKLAIAIAVALCVGTLAFACACKEDEGKKYSVTYEAGYAGATEVIPAESYAEGDTVTLRGADTYKREGYLFVNWSDGSSTYGAGASYKMPARNVVFTAQWKEEADIPADVEAEKIESFPAGNLTLENGNAKAHYIAEYADTGLAITAWVEDKDVSVGGNVSANDGVSVIFAKQERIAGVSEKTYRVRADLDGNVQAATVHNTQVAQVSGLTAEAKYLTLDGEKIAGYRIKLTMPYAAIDVTKESHNAVVALGFQNADQLLYDTSLGTDITQSHTYLLVNADGTFAANPDLELGNVWGNGGTGLKMKNVWALDHDDGTADAYIEMTGLADDNNIYMRNSNVSKAYAEVQIHASELRNDEKWGKFGLELIKQDGTLGYLYFVDANSGDGKNFNVGAKNVNYVQWSGGWIWATDTNLGTVGDTSAVYAGENNYVTLGIYRNQNKVQFYVNGNALAAVELKGISATDEPMYFGLISFNIMLKVKGYKLLTADSELASYQQAMDAWFEQPVAGPDKTLDGDLADWTNEEKSNPFLYASDQGRSVTVYATKGRNGVNIFYDWYHLTDETDEEEQFWLNTNVEFRLGGNADKQYMVAANGTHPGIGDGNYYFHTEKEGNLFHTVAEIFVPYKEISGGYGYDDTPVPANFYVKVGGESGNVWETGDWWRSGGNDAQGILITKHGILGATQKTMDGDLSDWADAEWHQKNRYQWTALLNEDGLYLAVKTSAEHIAADRQFVSLQDGPAENYRWWLNQNLEIQGHDGSVLRAARVIYFGGKAYHSSFINDAGAKLTQNANADDELVFELFIARQNFIDPTARSVKAWIGGQLFDTAEDEGNHWNMALEGDVIGGEGLEPLPAGETWGDGGAGLSRTDNWDVSHDVSPDPYIEMLENKANTDNNIYMPATKGQSRFYAETKITVKGAGKMADGNYDGYPKFGVIVYSADGSRGVLFYVDAVSNEAAPAINGNSVNLGYNVRTNGNWSSWNTIPGKTVGANSGVYQNDQYVTLGIYRQGIVFSLVYNGEVITTLYNAGIKESEDVYFGIVSFNLLLKAKEYKLETNEANLEKYKVDTSKKVDVDYLFCGDSYIDTAFFQTWKDAFGSLNAINLGVGGTKVEYWQDQLVTQLTHYNPKNIIIHIGVNNLDDAGESDEAVIKKLDALFKGFKQEWPNVNIYYISIVDNVQFHQFVAKYEKVNEWVQKQTNVTFIDMRPYVTKTNGAADLMWFADGLHYSPMGYALLVREIGEALGLNNLVVTTKDGLGNLTVNNDVYLTHSASFKVEGEGEEQVWHAKQETPYTETLLPIEGAHGANVYAEAKLSAKQYLGGDNWAKAGLGIASKKGTYYYFIDLNSTNNPNNVFINHYAALVWRPEKLIGNGWLKDWEWGNIQPHFNNSENGYANLGNDVKFDYNVGKGFITLGVAKVGSKLYFTADGHVVGLPVDSQFAADEEVSVFVLNFNMELYVKGGYATTDLNTIYTKAPAAHGTSKTLDGKLDDWTETQKTNPFRVPITDGRSFTVYAYMDEYGVNIFYDVVHNTHKQKGRLDGGNYSHWWESTNVEFRLGGDTFGAWSGLGAGPQWLVSANGQRTVDEAFMKTETLENGKYHTVAEIFVSYENIVGFDSNSDYVPATFGFKVEGETSSGAGLTNCAGVGLWFTADGFDWDWRGAEVTKNGIRTGTVKKIDGDLSDWTEEFKDAGHSEVLTEAKYSAFLGTDGLYVALRIKGTNINVTATHSADADDGWWHNTNVEFCTDNPDVPARPAIGHWAGKVMTFGGKVYHTGYISDAEMKVLEDGTVCFEIFISNRWLKDPSAQSIKMDIGGQVYSDATGATWQNYAHDAGAVTVTRKA